MADAVSGMGSAQRYNLSLRMGRVSDVTVLSGNFGAAALPTPSQLLTIDVTSGQPPHRRYARDTAANLAKMGRIASQQFRAKHPDAPEDVARVFAWSYTFDYK